MGYLKGVGRIYQQTVIDTHSAVTFGKVYSAKVPVTAADPLNDRVLRFFEEEGVPVLRVLTNRTAFFGDPMQLPGRLSFSSYSIKERMSRSILPVYTHSIDFPSLSGGNAAPPPGLKEIVLVLD